MSGWGCPHEVDGKCLRVNNIPCDMGMKGCVLFGRFNFADASKNRPKKKPSISQSEISPQEKSEKP